MPFSPGKGSLEPVLITDGYDESPAALTCINWLGRLKMDSQGCRFVKQVTLARWSE